MPVEYRFCYGPAMNQDTAAARSSHALNGMDSLLSIVQMPAGVPVATFAIGKAGATNAALFAASLLALEDAAVAKALREFRSAQTEAVLAKPDPRPS